MFDNNSFMLRPWMFTVVLVCLAVGTYCEKDYTDFVNTLKTAMSDPQFKHSAYNRLAEFSDTFGPRMWGSAVL